MSPSDMRGKIETLRRRMEWLEARTKNNPASDSGGRNWLLSEVGALRWALELMEAALAARRAELGAEWKAYADGLDTRRRR